ncbi:hypothetical protein D3C72_1059390 [compost metagenome]
MKKKRWKLGNYELTYNPKSVSESWDTTGEIKTTANGRITSENRYFEEKTSFSFDVYNAPTKTEKKPRFTFPLGTYRSISFDDIKNRTYLLRSGAGNIVDVFDEGGNQIKVLNLAGVGEIVAFCFGYPYLICFWSTKEMSFYDENGSYIRKYIYTDNELLDLCDLSQDYITSQIYGVSKFGKVFRLNEGDSVYVLQFSDYSANKTNNYTPYRSINTRSDGYMSILKNRTLIFLNPSFEITYALELDRDSLDVFSNTSGPDAWALVSGEVRKIKLNISGLEVDKLKNSLTSGIISLSDENNITRYFAVESTDIQRVRNLQDSRYTFTINGTLL